MFTKFDKDKSGTMDMKEFYQLIGEKQSIFGDSIFELIDVDNSGTLDYSEFVAACGHFWYVYKKNLISFLSFHSNLLRIRWQSMLGKREVLQVR